MIVRFIDVQTEKETFMTDLNVIPRNGDLVSPDYPKCGGTVVNVLWKLCHNKTDNTVIVYYITHEDKERLDEKKRQATCKRK